MTDNVVDFPEKPEEAPAWRCGCGSYHFFIYEDAKVQCVPCGDVRQVQIINEHSQMGRVARMLTAENVVGAAVFLKNRAVFTNLNEYPKTDEERAWWRDVADNFLDIIGAYYGGGKNG
tara:strand:- start:480 stop:833 length:354 start_codon:yes stop_codon:yes gene_type:complete